MQKHDSPVPDIYKKMCRTNKRMWDKPGKNVLQILSMLQILSSSPPTCLNSTIRHKKLDRKMILVLTMWCCFRYDFQEDNNALRWCSLEDGHLFLSSRLGQAITNTSWSGYHKYRLIRLSQIQVGQAITNTSWSKQGQSILEMDVSWQFFSESIYI